MTETILTNAEIVREDEIVRGTLVIRGGEIAEVSAGRSAVPGAVDCEGDHLIPGLIELHTDNLERHIEPRPRVHWPHMTAILAHDGELASAGITTVFDAMRVGSVISDGREDYRKYARELSRELFDLRGRGVLRISHLLHLRAEVCSETLLEELGEFGDEDRVGILSIMDHTPGQRQFRDVSKLRDYVLGKHGGSEADFEAHLENLRGLQARFGAAHEAGAVDAAKRLGAVLASHDDTTEAQVATSAGHGVRLAEFPTTEEAAGACHDARNRGDDGRAEPHPGRLAFGQRRGAKPGRGGPSRHSLVGLHPVLADARGFPARGSLGGPAPRHPHRDGGSG